MYEEFRKHETVQYWMDALANRAPATKSSYLKHLRAFCEATGKTPDELIAQRKQDLKSDDLYVRHRTEMMLKKHIADLDDQECSISTQKLRYASIRSFFQCHYMALELRRTDAPSGEPIGKEPASRKQIKRMIDIAEPFKFRCLISFLKDCGWRLGDVLNLTWGDMNDMGEGFWNFKKVTEKRRVVGNGFVGPETTELMQLYRKKREESGETITPESPLFESETGDFFQGISWVSYKVSKIAEMVGAKNVSAHSLRKYFQRTLENPELHVHKTWIKQFMGKKIIGSDRPYVEDRTEKLLEAYKMAYDNLRLEARPLDEKERRIRAIIDHARLMGTSEDKIQQVVKMLATRKRTLDPDTIIEMLKQGNNTQEDPNDCPNGEHCSERFEEIDESDLLTYLQDGWQIVHKLDNGNVIIRRG